MSDRTTRLHAVLSKIAGRDLTYIEGEVRIQFADQAEAVSVIREARALLHSELPPEETNDLRLAALHDLAYRDGAQQALAIAHRSLQAADQWLAKLWEQSKEARVALKATEWHCPCGAPLADSTAVCRKCFPQGIASPSERGDA